MQRFIRRASNLGYMLFTSVMLVRLNGSDGEAKHILCMSKHEQRMKIKFWEIQVS